MARLILPALFLFVAALPPPAGAENLPRDKALGFAAARYDAFLNLTDRIYPIRTTRGRTIEQLVREDVRLRDGVEAALRGARVVDGPHFDDAGVVRVVAELNTVTLPFGLRLKIRGLPRIIQVDGVADKAAAVTATMVSIGKVTAEVKQWAGADIKARGQADVDRSLKPEQAKQDARHRALADAWTALVKKAELLRLDADVTVKAFLDRHPDVRPRLNATSIAARLVSESVDRRGITYKVKVSLPGRAVMRSLTLGGYRRRVGKTLSALQVELARKNARRSAVGALKRKVYALPLSTGATMEIFLKRKAEIKATVDKLCRYAPTNRVEVTEDGLVKMRVELSTRLLPREVRELLRPGTSNRITALGGGLPVEPQGPAGGKTPGDAPKAGGAP